jgi:hypothetical protein
MTMENFEKFLNDVCAVQDVENLNELFRRAEPKISYLLETFDENELLNGFLTMLGKLERLTQNILEGRGDDFNTFRWCRGLSEVSTLLAVILWGSVRGDVFLMLADHQLLSHWVRDGLRKGTENCD